MDPKPQLCLHDTRESPPPTPASCTEGWGLRMVQDRLTDPQEAKVWVDNMTLT